MSIMKEISYNWQETYLSCLIWEEAIDVKEIEQMILRRNKHHLQHTTVEEGRVHGPIMQHLIAD